MPSLNIRTFHQSRRHLFQEVADITKTKWKSYIINKRAMIWQECVFDYKNCCVHRNFNIYVALHMGYIYLQIAFTLFDFKPTESEYLAFVL